MYKRLLPLTSLLVAFGCGSDSGSKKQTTDDTSVDTGVTTVTTTVNQTNGFQLRDQEGSLLVMNRARSVQAPEGYTVSAMFADTLQGVVTPNWCIGGGPCISQLPAVGADVAYDISTWDPSASAYNWIGNEMFVGSAKLPFVNDFTRGLAYYDVDLPMNPDSDLVSVFISGEWGDHEIDDFALPAPIEITSPDPLVSLGLQGSIPFRWTPPAEGNIYIRFEGGGTDRIFQLENSGTHDFDTTSLGAFDPAAVEVFFGVWIEREVDVNGNRLQSYSAWEQPYQGTECTAYPDGQLIGAAGSPPGPDMNPAWLTMAFDGVIENDRFYDYYNDSDGDGVPEVFTSAVFFDFYEDDPVNPGQIGQHLCQVVYDASNNLPTNFISQSGAIYSSFDLQLADGESDCNSIDVNIWNTIDVRDVLESPQYQWGFGIGEVMDTLPILEAKYDPDWAIWQPLLVGGYISIDGVFAYEWDEVHVYPMSDCATVQPDKTEIDAPTAGPVFNADYTGIPLFAFPFLPPP